jgi:predicted dithiol-disulfide oxidoreductase (DUF899 family)
VKEKTLTRARDALAAERPRMPWMAVEKAQAARKREAEEKNDRGSQGREDDERDHER